MLPSPSNSQRSAYVLFERRQVTEVQAALKEWNPEFVKRFSEADSEGKFDISVGKHLGGESLDGGGLAPGMERQTSLAAGLLQKSFPVPTMFDGNLGQQQAAASAQREDQTVAPDFHCLGINREQAGENAQRNLQLKSLFLRNRQETRVFESGGAGRFGHRTIQRRDGHGIPDASPKVSAETTGSIAGKTAAQIKSREHASWIRQPGWQRRRLRRGPALEDRKNCPMRNEEQSPALIERKFWG